MWLSEEHDGTARRRSAGAPSSIPSPSGNPMAQTATSETRAARQAQRVGAAYGLADHLAARRPDRGASAARERSWSSRIATRQRGSPFGPSLAMADRCIASTVPGGRASENQSLSRHDSTALVLSDPAVCEESAVFTSIRTHVATCEPGVCATRQAVLSGAATGPRRRTEAAMTLSRRDLLALGGMTLAGTTLNVSARSSAGPETRRNARAPRVGSPALRPRCYRRPTGCRFRSRSRTAASSKHKAGPRRRAGDVRDRGRPGGVVEPAERDDVRLQAAPRRAVASQAARQRARAHRRGRALHRRAVPHGQGQPDGLHAELRRSRSRRSTATRSSSS